MRTKRRLATAMLAIAVMAIVSCLSNNTSPDTRAGGTPTPARAAPSATASTTQTTTQATPAPEKWQTLSVKEWEALSGQERIDYINRYIDFTADAEAEARDVTGDEIRSYFRDAGSNKIPRGLVVIAMGVNLLDKSAHGGHCDLSQVYIEDVVQWAIIIKFVQGFPE
jgi:hypothetical protein